MSFLTLIKRPTFILKIVELVLAVICAILLVNSVVATSAAKIQLTDATILGHIMVGIVIILSYLLVTPLHKYIMLSILVSGVVMFITSGALVIEGYTKLPSNRPGGTYTHILGAGVLAMLNGCVYAIDTLLTYKEHAVVVQTSVVHT